MPTQTMDIQTETRIDAKGAARLVSIFTPGEIASKRLTEKQLGTIEEHEPQPSQWGDYEANDVEVRFYTSERGHRYALRYIDADHRREWKIISDVRPNEYMERGYQIYLGGTKSSYRGRACENFEDMTRVIEASEALEAWAQDLPDQMTRQRYEQEMQTMGLTPVGDPEVRKGHTYKKSADGGRLYPHSHTGPAGESVYSFDTLAYQKASILCQRRQAALNAAVEDEMRPADRWMEWLGITGEYTGPQTYITDLRPDLSGLTAKDLNRETVQRILDSAAERLSENVQNVHAEKDLAGALADWCNQHFEQGDPVRSAFQALYQKLNARNNGWDLGIGALDPRDSFGNVLGGSRETT